MRAVGVTAGNTVAADPARQESGIPLHTIHNGHSWLIASQ
jgi:hypothetical protein